jgi:hypothetical protein
MAARLSPFERTFRVKESELTDRKLSPLERTFGIDKEEARIIEKSARNYTRPIAIGLIALLTSALYLFQTNINNFLENYQVQRREYRLSQ